MDDTRPYRNVSLARFEDVAELSSATLTTSLSGRGGSVTADLVWRALKDAPQPLTEYVHIVGPDGRLAAQSDGIANRDRFPAVAWRRNQFILSPRVVMLPETLPPGSYRVFVGLYWSATQERLAGAPHGAQALASKSIEIGEFNFPPR
jgi:hypothetical protein